MIILLAPLTIFKPFTLMIPELPEPTSDLFDLTVIAEIAALSYFTETVGAFGWYSVHHFEEESACFKRDLCRCGKILWKDATHVILVDGSLTARCGAIRSTTRCRGGSFSPGEVKGLCEDDHTSRRVAKVCYVSV